MRRVEAFQNVPTKVGRLVHTGRKEPKGADNAHRFWLFRLLVRLSISLRLEVLVSHFGKWQGGGGDSGVNLEV